MTADAQPEVDEARLEEFMGQAVTDLGAAMNGALVMIGAQLGLWKAMNGAGALSAADLEERSGVSERYCQEWLSAQAASGYVEYDADTGKFTLPPEQGMAFADENSPVYMLGGYHVVSSAYKDRERIAERFRSGEGFGWHEHDPELFLGTEGFFRPGYRAHLVAEWLPALEGVEEKLRRGAKVADIGCGHGPRPRSWPRPSRSPVPRLRLPRASIERARRARRRRGASATGPVRGRERQGLPRRRVRPRLLLRLPARHGRSGRRGAARPRDARRRRHGDAGRAVCQRRAAEDNLNPVGRIFYAASTLICTPTSLAQEVGLALGAQAGEKRLGDVAREAGFGRFNRATETGFNLILEARP